MTVSTELVDWAATLFIGALVASWWRGTWVLLDIWMCDQPSDAGITTGDSFCHAGILTDYHIALHRDAGWYSLAIGATCTLIGVSMIWCGLWRPKVVISAREKQGIRISSTTAFFRILTIYVLGWAAVNVWRGVWYLTDYFLWPDQHLVANENGEWPLVSFWTSSVIGSSVCFLLQSGNALLAPPAIFLLDGPGVNPP
jgi:Fuseless